MKKIYGYSILVSLLLVLTACQNSAENQADATKSDYSVAYVDSEQKDSTQRIESSDKTPNQISAEEGIDAEQIVVKITSDGYVTSHGDHYHFYNGKVSYDAILSEELIISDESYVFIRENVISEVLDGYIMRQDDETYTLYLKPDSARQNIRTKAEIEAAMNQ